MTDIELKQRILSWWNDHNEVKADSVIVARTVSIFLDGALINPDSDPDVRVCINLVDKWRGELSFTTGNIDMFVAALESGNASIGYMRPYETYFDDIWRRRKEYPAAHLKRQRDGSLDYNWPLYNDD